MPWPGVVTSDLIAVFTGYIHVPSLTLVHLQVNTPPTSNVRLFVDGAPVIALPATSGTCPNATTTNRGEVELTAGHHYMQLFFQRSADNPTAGLSVYIAQANLDGSGDALEWMPLGGRMGDLTGVSDNARQDNGAGCTADYTGYRHCRCYACAYAKGRPPCEDFCAPRQAVELGVPDCPGYYLNLPDSVLKFSQDWRAVTPADERGSQGVGAQGG